MGDMPIIHRDVVELGVVGELDDARQDSSPFVGAALAGRVGAEATRHLTCETLSKISVEDKEKGREDVHGSG